MTASTPQIGDLNIFEMILTRVKAACGAFAASGGDHDEEAA